jgi:hypothetical protein
LAEQFFYSLNQRSRKITFVTLSAQNLRLKGTIFKICDGILWLGTGEVVAGFRNGTVRTLISEGPRGDVALHLPQTVAFARHAPSYAKGETLLVGSTDLPAIQKSD